MKRILILAQRSPNLITFLIKTLFQLANQSSTRNWIRSKEYYKYPCLDTNSHITLFSLAFLFVFFPLLSSLTQLSPSSFGSSSSSGRPPLPTTGRVAANSCRPVSPPLGCRFSFLLFLFTFFLELFSYKVYTFKICFNMFML